MSNKLIWKIFQAPISTTLILSSKSSQWPQNNLLNNTEIENRNLFLCTFSKSPEDFTKEKSNLRQEYNIHRPLRDPVTRLWDDSSRSHTRTGPVETGLLLLTQTPQLTSHWWDTWLASEPLSPLPQAIRWLLPWLSLSIAHILWSSSHHAVASVWKSE